MTQNNYLILKAFNFAAQKHTDQRRKGPRAEPYINHPAEVAWMLTQHVGANRVDVIVAGILHDTIEDTDTTYDELVREFGQNIADIVMECTDDKSLPKEERKRLQIVNAPHKSEAAKLVKLADRTANLLAVLESPPDGWPQERVREYFVWSKAAVDGCRGINTGLEAGFDAAYNKGKKIFPGL